MKELFQSDEKGSNDIHMDTSIDQQVYMTHQQSPPNPTIMEDKINTEQKYIEFESNFGKIAMNKSLVSSTTDADQIIQSFDKLYERVKNGDASYASTNVDESMNKSLEESRNNINDDEGEEDLVLITKVSLHTFTIFLSYMSTTFLHVHTLKIYNDYSHCGLFDK